MRLLLILILCQALTVFASEPQGLIFGTALSSDTGEAISGATVRLLVVNQACPQREVLTNEKGQFWFDHVPVGQYRVSVTKDGFVRETYGEGIKNPAGQEFLITDMAKQYELEFSLRKSAVVSGHVYDSEGLAVKNSPVVFQSVVNHRAYRTSTDDLGFFYIADLPADFYKISARRYDAAKKMMVGERWFYPGTLDESGIEAVELQTEKTSILDIRFGTPAVPAWVGKVVGPEQEPVASVDFGFLRLENSKWIPLAACRTTEDGTCSVRNLAPGLYLVYLTHIPAPYTTGVAKGQPVGLLESFTQRLVVETGKPATTLFQLERGVRVEVIIYNAQGAPVATESGIELKLTHFRQLSNLKVPFHAGILHPSPEQYEFYVNPELEYDFSVNHQNPNSEYSVTKVDWNRSPLSNPIRISKNAADKMEIRIEPGSTISGIASGAKIVFAEKSENEPERTNSYSPSSFHAMVQDGNFLFKALPPGTYRLRPNKKNGPFKEVTVSAGESKTVVLP